MERIWPKEALRFESSVAGALKRLGGTGLARRCERQPEARAEVLLPVLEELGVLDLDPRSDAVEAAAAALAVRAAGAVLCPWPLVQMLSAPRESRSTCDAVYLSDGAPHRLEHLDLTQGALCLQVDKRTLQVVEHEAEITHMPLDPFGVRCSLGEDSSLPEGDPFDLYVILAAFWVSGALGYARDLAAEHARERRQFGRPISEFGGVQWRLADIAAACEGLWELACFTLARFIEARLEPADAPALLYAMLEAARGTLDNAHQVLAATGLCEVHDLTLVERHLQPVLRRSGGLPRALGLLSAEIARSGFDNLYPVRPGAPLSKLSEIATS